MKHIFIILILLSMTFSANASNLYNVAVDKETGDVKGYTSGEYQSFIDSGYSIVEGVSSQIKRVGIKNLKWVDSNSDGEIQKNELQIKTSSDLEQDEIDAKNSKVTKLDVSLKQAFVAFIKVYNSKTPPQYNITLDELKDEIINSFDD